METNLRKYFPMIRTRKEVLDDIHSNPTLTEIFHNWNEEQQQEFLDFCTGAKGIRILYDAFFKEIMNPEYTPERLEELLSLILKRKVKILNILPTDSTRIADESSLLIMDIVVELEDKSIANVEVQRLGYAFPGQRCACYSSDLLLRQYKRIKGQKKKAFSYKDIKKVYTIVLFDKSVKEFHAFPDYYIHRFRQTSDTGLQIDLLQEFIFIALDIYRNTHHNINIDNSLEKVMGMFSKELLELDRNTVQYMIDEMQDTIDAQNSTIDAQKEELETWKADAVSKADILKKQEVEIEALKRKLEEANLKQ